MTTEPVTPDEVQALHEAAQLADHEHDLVTCWCCCWTCDFDYETVTNQ